MTWLLHDELLLLIIAYFDLNIYIYSQLCKIHKMVQHIFTDIWLHVFIYSAQLNSGKILLPLNYLWWLSQGKVPFIRIFPFLPSQLVMVANWLVRRLDIILLTLFLWLSPPRSFKCFTYEIRHIENVIQIWKKEN